METFCTPAGYRTNNKLIFFVGLIMLTLGHNSLANDHVLIYTKNGEGFVHKNIDASVACLKGICDDNGWTYEVSDEASVFTSEKINRFDVIIFSNTNNEAFDTEAQRNVFKDFIHNGGGFVGIHSACGSERNWPWFWANMGGKFLRHPPLQPFEMKVLDSTHPSTKHLEDIWRWEDECYFMDELNPRMHVLLAVDLRSIDDDKKAEYPGRMFGDYFPLAWYQEFEGGKQWYTALGHKDEHYTDKHFVAHLAGGIAWAMEKTETSISK